MAQQIIKVAQQFSVCAALQSDLRPAIAKVAQQIAKVAQQIAKVVQQFGIAGQNYGSVAGQLKTHPSALR